MLRVIKGVFSYVSVKRVDYMEISSRLNSKLLFKMTCKIACKNLSSVYRVEISVENAVQWFPPTDAFFFDVHSIYL